jgi:DNA polymerase III epsilon subunit family exonuclease
MATELSDTTFVVFDVETTGLSCRRGGRICEVGALKLKGDVEFGRFQSLVNPERPIPPAITAIHHITDAMVAGAPTFREIAADFLGFAEGGVLAAYNAPFDIGFLSTELGRLGTPAWDAPAVDVLILARRLLPGIRHRLCQVASFLEIPFPVQHRALADVEVTAKVFRRLLARMGEQGLPTLEELYQLAASRNVRASRRIDPAIRAILEEAADGGLRLQILYASTSKREITERLIDPKELVERRGAEYVVAWCHLRQANRSFRLDGILDVQIVDGTPDLFPDARRVEPGEPKRWR